MTTFLVGLSTLRQDERWIKSSTYRRRNDGDACAKRGKKLERRCGAVARGTKRKERNHGLEQAPKGRLVQMSLLKNMTGLRFGKLAVMKRAGSDRHGSATWLCHCGCGRKTIVSGTSLRSGKTMSCGCYGRQIGRMNTTHGHLRSYHATPEYVAWRGMLARCYLPRSYGFLWYGGKGIRVCKRWQTDFAAFLTDVGPKPGPHMMLSRKDKDDDYRPGNCEWSALRRSRLLRVGDADHPRSKAIRGVRR
jgi:hypothetical protein